MTDEYESLRELIRDLNSFNKRLELFGERMKQSDEAIDAACHGLADDIDIQTVIESVAPAELKDEVSGFLRSARTRSGSCSCDIDHDNPPLVHFGGQGNA